MLTVTNLKKAYESKGAVKSRGRRAAPTMQEQPPVFAVDGVSFALEPGELFTLLGPSGCGKTTTLRCIAGLETPQAGSISVGNRVLYDSSERVNVPAHDRRLGMVFQSYAIWPHLSVYKNAAFPLEVLPRSERPSRDEIRRRVTEALEVTELGAFAQRSATALSGGQQQRLALARGLVIQPALMLLDEPLSNLDAKLRETMRFELKRLQRELGLTTVYVTHDQVEALTMSDRIAIMNQGKVVQIGKPRDIYERPNSRFVADFVGATNFLAGKVIARDGELCRVQLDVGDLWVKCGPELSVGSEVLLSLRPESLTLSTEASTSTVANEWSGVIVSRMFFGDAVDHVVRLADTEIRNRSNPAQSIVEGSDVFISIAPDKIVIVPVAA